jgi:hypothetical protein
MLDVVCFVFLNVKKLFNYMFNRFRLFNGINSSHVQLLLGSSTAIISCLNFQNTSLLILSRLSFIVASCVVASCVCVVASCVHVVASCVCVVASCVCVCVCVCV